MPDFSFFNRLFVSSLTNGLASPLAALEYAMQWLLQLGYQLSGSYGWAIILLSFAVNICLIPAFSFAEILQERERRLQRRFQPKLDEFRRAFSGASLHAVRRTYYRQQNYHPVSGLRSSLGLLLQIPFFVAAYNLLSHYPAFRGQSFGFLQDLMQPDQLLPILDERFNLLPFLMSVLNLWAAALYGSKLNRNERRQIYWLALAFFVLLYNAPSALLLYWNCNNLFSVCKNWLGQKFAPNILGAAAPPLLKTWCQRCQKNWRILVFQNTKTRRLCIVFWALCVLQIVFLLLFYERIIFFKEADSSIPEAIMALYLASIYILSILLLQLIINFWRSLHNNKQNQFSSRMFSILRLFQNPLSRLLPALLAVVLIGLVFLSLQGQTFFANAMWDRLSLLSLSLLALALALSEEFRALTGKNRPFPRTWTSFLTKSFSQSSTSSQEFSRSPNKSYDRQLDWSLACNILCLNLLIFVALPLSLAASSPSELPQIFADLKRGLLPGFALSSLAFALLFLGLKFWGNRAFYRLLQFLSFTCVALALLNAFLRPGDYGTLSDFIWDQPERFQITKFQRLADIVFLLGFTALPLVLWRKNRLPFLLPKLLIIVVLLFSGYQYTLLRTKQAQPQTTSQTDTAPLLQLSQSGHNVIVLMLDRFIGGFVPELLESYPEFATGLRDFTWYANTVSLGPTTLVSLPSILGGYDYSIFRINERLEAGLAPNLAQEINRAYQVLPLSLQQHGYHSVIFNPQYANFAARGDLRIFAGTGIEVRDLGGNYATRYLAQKGIAYEELGGRSDRMLIMLGLLRSALPSMRPSIYDEGVWLGANASATGKYRTLVNEYSALYYLSEKVAANGQKPLFFFLNNLVSHEPDFIGRNLEPSLKPITQMTESEAQRFRSLKGTRHFYASGAALKLLLRLLERLRELKVYSNTTIIALSDHSYDIYDPTMQQYKNPKPSSPKSNTSNFNPGYLHPLLLVKQAGERREVLQQDWKSFMSVADLTALLSRELGLALTDPFTGKNIGHQRSLDEKAKGLETAFDAPWNINNIKVRVAIPQAFRVKKNIFESTNWQRLW